MQRSRVLPVIVASLLAVPGAAATTTSGLQGMVTRGPVTPVCREGTPCDGPAAVTLVFARADALPRRTRSAADGTYQILLPPGYYTVTTSLSGPSHKASPTHVHVRRGHVDKLDFSIDTGIR